MNEQAFFERLVTFSFGGHEFMENTYEVVILMPENKTVEQFKDSYNKIVQKIENKNSEVNKKLEKNREKCREISFFLKKYRDKENIKEQTQAKINKKEKELDALLKQWSDIRKDLVNLDNEFKNIIYSIGGVILEDKITNTLTDHNNSSMIVHSMF
jgi:acyl carrier protein phosphodiesterase